MKLTMKKPFDLHNHLRRGAMLKTVAPETAKDWHRALIMPNTQPPILTLEDALPYYEEVLAGTASEPDFRPLMTIKIVDTTDPAKIRRDFLGKKTCVVAGKIYPKNLTTNSHDGVSDFFALNPVFEAMQEADLVLCIHGEMPGKGKRKGAQNRERKFLRTLKFIAKTFPRLRIVMEHITTKAAVDAILELPDNVAATVTVPHLILTLEDVGGDRCSPHNFCKPVAKTRQDRKALRMAAVSGCPKFFFGSDSAPHPREGKERGMDCCAGIFSAPVALPLLAEIFEKKNALGRLEGFTYTHGGNFYRLIDPNAPHPDITLVKESWTVPLEYGGVVPFKAGETISWQVKR